MAGDETAVVGLSNRVDLLGGWHDELRGAMALLKFTLDAGAFGRAEGARRCGQKSSGRARSTSTRASEPRPAAGQP